MYKLESAATSTKEIQIDLRPLRSFLFSFKYKRARTQNRFVWIWFVFLCCFKLDLSLMTICCCKSEQLPAIFDQCLFLSFFFFIYICCLALISVELDTIDLFSYFQMTLKWFQSTFFFFFFFFCSQLITSIDICLSASPCEVVIETFLNPN